MKRYKLLKALPNWEAGTKFILKEDWNLYGTKNGKEVMVYSSKTLKELGFLDLEEWIEETTPRPKSIWDLKDWDYFWYIFKNDIYEDTIFDLEFFQNNYLEVWNAFLTEKEAKQELMKRQAIQRVKKYCLENNLNTEYKTWRTEICATKYWDIRLQSVENYFVPNPIWYFHKNIANKILEKFAEDLKIIFNV